MNKKITKISIGIAILIVIGLFVFNMSWGWLYVKFDGNVYVANRGGSEDYSIKEQVGCVQNKIPKIIKPFGNNQSNGFPYGTQLYASDDPTQLFAKFGDKYYPLQDIERAEGWGNAIKIKIKNNNVVYE